MNETELVERCGKGDNLARKQLYERYAGQLMAVCVRYTGDREVAQDVLHDGFLNIFRSFSQFTYKGEGSLKAWLTRIMVNEALGYLRKKASTNQEVIVEELPDVIDGDEDDFEQIPQSVLMQFIKELPDGYRTVFNLYVLEEKGHIIESTESSLAAVIMDDELKALFNVDKQVPLLKSHNTALNSEGEIIYVEDAIYRSDKYILEINISKREGKLK